MGTVTWNDFRELIENHYKRQESRYLHGGRRVSSGWEYYYNTSEFESAFQIANLIKAGIFQIGSDVDHIFFNINKDEDQRKLLKTRSPLMLKFKENEESFLLNFFAIIGYEIVRSHGRKQAVRITHVEKPIFQMMILKSDGSLLEKNKTYENEYSPLHFSWWFNRLLRENDTFRRFIIELFLKLGNNKYIYRDISKCIEKNHYCLINVPFKEIEKHYTPELLIKSITHCRLKINFNKCDLNYAFYIAKISDWIQETDWGRLISISENDILEMVTLNDIYYEEPQCINFMRKYFQRVLGNIDWDTNDLIKQYVYNCIENGTKLSLKIQSITSLKEKKEEERIRNLCNTTYETEIIVRKNSKFALLADRLPEGFEWIKTKERLYFEANRQKNCVLSYLGRIKNDELAILHWIRGSYTIEVRANEYGFLHISQMKGRNNTEPLTCDYEFACSVINSIPTMEVENNSIKKHIDYLVKTTDIDM